METPMSIKKISKELNFLRGLTWIVFLENHPCVFCSVAAFVKVVVYLQRPSNYRPVHIAKSSGSKFDLNDGIDLDILVVVGPRLRVLQRP